MVIDLVAIHRINVEPMGFKNTPEGIRTYFEEVKRWKHPAYTAVLWPSGERWQWAPIGAPTNHAGGDWVTGCVSIAHVGDFREEAPCDALWRLSVRTVAELCWALDLVPERRTARKGKVAHEVCGHSEIAAAEGRVWRCPGAAWPLHRYRAEVERGRTRLARDLPDVPREERLALFGWR
ncbi:MAG: N-acetylmuramoyl-L-alanine amidase [Myxococcota bacterium]